MVSIKRWRSKLASPVPHVEQVPCRYDKAVFPTQTVPKLSVADYEVDISQFKINKININSGQFRSIYKGGDGYSREIGKMLFQVKLIKKILVDQYGQIFQTSVITWKLN